MRLFVNKDKLEELLNRHRKRDKASRWVFPPRLLPTTSKFAVGETILQALRFPLLYTVLVGGIHAAIFGGVGLYFYLYEHVPLRHIVALYRLMPHQIMDSVYAPLIVFPFLFIFNLLLSLTSRWAWNRRADRLNREDAVPLAVPAALPGVWPPPPTRT